ncbi:hypothetical protein DLX68_00020 [Shigella sonnei]|nr:hypothetical protein [Shigella sonnei]
MLRFPLQGGTVSPSSSAELTGLGG